MVNPRPTQLGSSSSEIAEEVRQVRDTADTWKVYRKEWIVVSHCETREEADSAVSLVWQGRVLPEDIRLTAEEGPLFIEVFLWNQKSEWKHHAMAEIDAKGYGGDARVVGRNSREETLLRDYGIKRLTPTQLEKS